MSKIMAGKVLTPGETSKSLPGGITKVFFGKKSEWSFKELSHKLHKEYPRISQLTPGEIFKITSREAFGVVEFSRICVVEFRRSLSRNSRAPHQIFVVIHGIISRITHGSICRNGTINEASGLTY